MKQLKEKIKNMVSFFVTLFLHEKAVFMNGISLPQIIDRLILLFLFLLPWQTRWIFGPAYTNGLYNEYATLSLYGTEILLWGIIVLAFINFFRTKAFPEKMFSKEYVKQHPKRLLYAVLFLVLLCLLVRLNEPVSRQFVDRFLAGMIFTIIFLRSGVTFFSASIALWLAGVWQGLLGFWQFLHQHIHANKWLGIAVQDPYLSGASVVQTESERWLRAYGSFGSPNSLGIFLATIFILGLILYYKFISQKYRGWFLLGQVLILFGLLASFSRGAWIAAFIGLILFLFTEFNSWSDTIVQFVFKFLRAALIYGTVILIFVLSFSHLFNTRFKAEGDLEKMSVSERRVQMVEARELFLSSPIRGVGLGMYTLSLAKHITLPNYGFYQPAHNIYMMILTEVGLLGIITIFLLYFSLVWQIMQKNFVYLPVVAVIFIAGLFDHWLWTMFTGLIFWWVILALGVKDQKSKLI